MRDETAYTPSACKYKVYIIDEVHMLSTAAFNALLKTLEEPPAHVIFILATTEIQKVPATILSRCQRFSFKRILPHDMEQQLLRVAQAEAIDLTSDGAELLARMANGALRDALSLLDQCIAFYLGQALTYDKALEVLGAVDTAVYSRMFRYVADLGKSCCDSYVIGLASAMRRYSDGMGSEEHNAQILEMVRRTNAQVLTILNERMEETRA